MSGVLAILKGGYRAIGIAPNTFVRINQGTVKDQFLIWHRSMVLPGERSFLNFETEPECFFGTAVYKIRPDMTLQLIRENYDSSD